MIIFYEVCLWLRNILNTVFFYTPLQEPWELTDGGWGHWSPYSRATPYQWFQESPIYWLCFWRTQMKG